MSATPTIIWQDLPLAVRIPDTERPAGTTDRRPPPHLVRCLARSRGDTYTASRDQVPEDGGYRCQFKARPRYGLCHRHWAAADDQTRQRACQLVRELGMR